MSTELAVFVAPHLDRVKLLTGMVIAGEAQVLDAVDGLTFVQSLKRTLDKDRRARVDPLNAQVSEINAEYKPYLDAVSTAEGAVKAALLVWREKEARRIEAEQARVREENARRMQEAQAEQARRAAEAEALADATGGFLEPEAAPVEAPVRLVAPSAPPPTVRATLGSATVRKSWAFEVRSPADVPRAYLMVDETAIRMAVRSGVRAIEGVVIFEREEIAGRRA